jgi:hypothetical protein
MICDMWHMACILLTTVRPRTGMVAVIMKASILDAWEKQPSTVCSANSSFFTPCRSTCVPDTTRMDPAMRILARTVEREGLMHIIV